MPSSKVIVLFCSMDDKRVLPSESNMNTLSSLSTATYLGVLNVVSPRVPSLLPPSLAFPTTVDTEEVTIYLNVFSALLSSASFRQSPPVHGFPPPACLGTLGINNIRLDT